MAAQREPQDQPDDAASPVPNRRERRGGKSGGPAVPSRQYSTRRRSG
jgi:hypothetical protein